MVVYIDAHLYDVEDGTRCQLGRSDGSIDRNCRDRPGLLPRGTH
jgi:hypothetical protein